MTTEFKLPLISEGVEAADIAAVHVHEGDVIQAGQIVLDGIEQLRWLFAGNVELLLLNLEPAIAAGLLAIQESKPALLAGPDSHPALRRE